MPSEESMKKAWKVLGLHPGREFSPDVYWSRLAGRVATALDEAKAECLAAKEAGGRSDFSNCDLFKIPSARQIQSAMRFGRRVEVALSDEGAAHEFISALPLTKGPSQ